MKKATCTSFETILNILIEKDIHTRDSLMEDRQLYTRFWLAAEDFARYALLSKTGKIAKDGRQLTGNHAKLDILEACGITTRNDVLMDCTVRMVEYFDNMRSKSTVAHMKNYAYAVVNSVVNTACRNLPPDDIRLVSLNGTVGADTVNTSNAYTYEDIIPDNTYNPEQVFSKREATRLLAKTLKAQQSEKQTREKQAVLREAAMLSDRPAEVMARFACSHLGMKPRELAELILTKGCNCAYDAIVLQVCEKNRIDVRLIRSSLAGHVLTPETLKADTNSAGQVAGQISRLVYRADRRLGR